MRNWILLGSLLLSLTACKDDDDDPIITPEPNPGADFATDATVGPTFTIREQDLPAPNPNASVTNFPQVLMTRPAGARFKAPAGFVVNLYEETIPNARNVTVAPNGDVFVAQSGMNQITVLRDTDNNGNSDQSFVWDAGGMLNRPHGMVFHNGHLYVANSGSVVRYTYTRGQTTKAAAPMMLPVDLPGGGNHPYRGLVIDSAAGKMYISVGSAGNVGPEDDPKRATIQMCNIDGTNQMTLGSGLRNPMPMAIEPVTRKLWSCVNERDGIGDELVPDYFASVSAGQFFGYPDVYLAPDNRDTRAPLMNPLVPQTRTPEVLFHAHAAALGLLFYTGTQFPAEYRGDAYVAMRGSWNRAEGKGYKIVRVKMNAQGQVETAMNGIDGSFEDFVTGWHTNPGTNAVPMVFGRPMSLAMAKDGSMLIADDAGGAVWRVRYKGM